MFVRRDDQSFNRPVALYRRQHHLADLAKTFSSDQLPSPTKCNNDRCCAAVHSGAVIAAIGSTLLRAHGIISPTQ
jgi:hypothetical protein